MTLDFAPQTATEAAAWVRDRLEHRAPFVIAVA
jgi:hypothetical protein